MVTDSYLKKYGHSRVRSSKQIQMPMQTHKTKTPAELLEKQFHPDVIIMTPVLRDHAALERHSKLVRRFIREGK